MALIGSIIALGAAAGFVAVAAIALWGGWQALRRELLRGFVSARPSPADRALTLLLFGAPLLGAALLALLAAARIALVALGRG